MVFRISHFLAYISETPLVHFTVVFVAHGRGLCESLSHDKVECTSAIAAVLEKIVQSELVSAGKGDDGVPYHLGHTTVHVACTIEAETVR